MHKLTGNAPPFIRDADAKGKNAYANLEMQRFIAKHGLHRFKMNPKFPFKSINLLRMLISLNGDDHIKFIEALTPAIWEEELDVSNVDAVARVLWAHRAVRQHQAELSRPPAQHSGAHPLLSPPSVVLRN